MARNWRDSFRTAPGSDADDENHAAGPMLGPAAWFVIRFGYWIANVVVALPSV